LGAAAVSFAAPKVEGAHLVGLVTASSIVATPYAHLYDETALIPACIMLMHKKAWIYILPAGLIFTGLLIPTTVSLVFLLMVFLTDATRHPDKLPGYPLGGAV
jgi:hypothetical protein